MSDPKFLRRRAAQARRAASIRTYGDTIVDRDLIKLADKLERDAAEEERDREDERSSVTLR